MSDVNAKDKLLGKDASAPIIEQSKEELEKTLKEEERIEIERLFEERVQAEVQRRLQNVFEEKVQQEVQKRKNLDVLNTSRVAIMVPVGSEYVHIRWATQLFNLARQVPSNTEFLPIGQYGVDQARQRAANMFMGLPGDFTHLLFLDTDIVPSDFALTNLLQDNKDIVSGIYANSLHTGLAAWVNEQPLQLPALVQANRVDPLVEADKVGMGLCLIKREVFKRLTSVDQPWFFYKVDEVGPHSEDFYFFSLLKRLNLKTYIDMRVQGLHMKPAIVAPNGQVSL